jgi:Mrp family chromosome partitioning ATPase
MPNVYKALERARRPDGQAVQPGRTLPPATTWRPRFAREMRALAARLQPLRDERGSVVLLFTACGRGEGASTVSRELAQHLAADGRRVLLCAALTGPTGQVSTTIDGGARPILAGPLETLCEADISDLRLDNAGLTGNIVFRTWLEQQREHFDYILIDAPPLLAQQSWSTMLQIPDGIILVLEAEKTRTIVVSSTISMIEEAGGHILGLVFNKRRQYIPKFLYRLL